MKKKKSKKLYYSLWITVFIMGSYLIAHYVSYYNMYNKTKSITEIFSIASKGFSRPFYFPDGIVSSFPIIGLFSFILFMAMMLEWNRNKLLSGIRKTATSKWNDDYQSYKHKYMDEENKRNMRMTETVSLSMDTRKTRRNNNIVVIGGSGSGKSRFLVKPNLCEMTLNTSFVCTDPAGELLAETGTMLENNGYNIKVFNLIDVERSNTYNPLEYIHTETDVILIVDCILKNTTDPNKKGGDDFWEKAQALLFQAIVFLLWEHSEELHLEKSMNTLIQLISGFQVSEEESQSNDVNSDSSKYFEGVARLGWYFTPEGEFRAGKPDGQYKDCEYHKPVESGEMDMAYRQYKDFKIGAGKTLKSILISANARLATLKIPAIANLLATDTISLESIGDEKTALFIIIPAENDAFNFIAAMMYTQLFQALYFHAGNDCLGSYKIYDNNGEIVKTFFCPKVEEKEEEESTEEYEIDFRTQAEKKIPSNDTDDTNNKKDKKSKSSAKINKTDQNNQTNMINDQNDKFAEEDKKEDELILDENKELQNQVDEFIKACKKVKLSKIGNKYFIKIPYNNEDVIVGTYGSKSAAIKRCEAIEKKCTYIRSKAPSLPLHTRFMLDEFANIGQIPDFTKKLATMRKHEISCTIILQNMAQIKNMYKDDWGSVMGNCDSLLFLGCPEYDTLEYISKLLGKEEIKKKSVSTSHGSKGDNTSISNDGKDLMTPDELYRMDNNQCIYILRGEYPFKDNKCPFDENTKNYQYTADADENNTYIVKKRAHSKDTMNILNFKPAEKITLNPISETSSKAYTINEINQAKTIAKNQNTNSPIPEINQNSEYYMNNLKSILNTELSNERYNDVLEIDEDNTTIDNININVSDSGNSEDDGNNNSNQKLNEFNDDSDSNSFKGQSSFW